MLRESRVILVAKVYLISGNSFHKHARSTELFNLRTKKVTQFVILKKSYRRPWSAFCDDLHEPHKTCVGGENFYD